MRKIALAGTLLFGGWWLIQPYYVLGASSAAVGPPARAILYEEDPANPSGNTFRGSASWQTESTQPDSKLQSEFAVRAHVEIPERHIGVNWVLRRNLDKSLPATHTIEITFSLPANFSNGRIANVPGLLMKQSETARGMPLAGLSVKVTDGVFLIGLSAVTVDALRNIQLLAAEPWVDIPIVYSSGRRAILAMEKGEAGSQAIAQALAQWAVPKTEPSAPTSPPPAQ